MAKEAGHCGNSLIATEPLAALMSKAAQNDLEGNVIRRRCRHEGGDLLGGGYHTCFSRVKMRGHVKANAASRLAQVSDSWAAGSIVSAIPRRNRCQSTQRDDLRCTTPTERRLTQDL